MSYERIESAQHEHSESPLHEFLYSVPPPYISRKILHQEKTRPGMRPFTWEIDKWFAGTMTYEERLDMRRFYKTKVSEYSGQATNYDPVTIEVTDTLEGLGLAPQTTGYPQGWNADWTPAAALTQSYNGNISGPPAGQNEVQTSQTVDVDQREGFPAGGLQPPNPVYPMVSKTYTMSNEPEFPPLLNTCVERLLARSFAGLVFSDAATGTWLEFERFNEYIGPYSNAPEVAPASFDATPLAETVATVRGFYDLVPWQLYSLCAPFEGSIYYPLVSYWVWPEWERTSATAGYTGNHITAERLVFKVNNAPSTDYWIARGVLKCTPTNLVTLHPVVHVFKSGTLTLGEELEVDFPFYSGGEGWRDFVRLGQNEISCGAVCFAILNETPAHWSTRTGISIKPTADSTIFSADSDITADIE